MMDQPRPPRLRGPVKYLEASGAVQELDKAAGKDQDQPAPWEIPTPVSLRREKAQKLQRSGEAAGDARRPAEGSSPPRPVRALDEVELDAIEARSLAGLVLTVEQAALRKDGGDRRAKQGRPWLPPKDQVA